MVWNEHVGGLTAQFRRKMRQNMNNVGDFTALLNAFQTLFAADSFPIVLYLAQAIAAMDG